MNKKNLLLLFLLCITPIITHANILNKIKKTATKAWKSATSKKTWENIGEDIKDTGVDLTKKETWEKAGDIAKTAVEGIGTIPKETINQIQKKILDPVRNVGLTIEKALADALNIDIKKYHFIILNATNINMEAQLETLDMLVASSGTASLLLPNNTIKDPLPSQKITIYATPDKSFCWKDGKAIYKDNHNKEVTLSLKKNRIAKCENLYAAIIAKKDSEGHPQKDTQGNFVFEVKRGDDAKKFMDTYNPEPQLKQIQPQQKL